MKNVIHNLRLGFLLVAVLFFLWGCSNSFDGLRSRVEAEKQKQPPPIAPLPEIRPVESYFYSVSHLRDPFTPDISEEVKLQTEAVVGPKPEPHPPEPLEDFALDSLQMVGTFQGKGVLWGLIRDPVGLIHKVREGNYLGRNNGKVLLISNAGVSLVELVENGNGGWIERQTSLDLEE